jgi:hypothetical protein
VVDSGGTNAHEAGADAMATLGYPQHLSQTGLFADIASDTLGPGVRAFQPKYFLWSDGAQKRRWLYLPDGAQIDTSDMDYWVYPVGTKVWKEFTVDGKRIETRMLHKVADGNWVMIAYQWRSDLSDADAVPYGVQNAAGTPHDIPQQSDCFFCHGNMPDRLLGVTAIQLSHAPPGVTLAELAQEGRLTNAPPAAGFTIPGDPATEQVLGYFHANCGHCHNPNSTVYLTAALQLWERTGELDTVEGTTGYRTTVLRPNGILPQLHIIEPGHPEKSELFLRISHRGPGGIVSQMPPIATEFVDTAAVDKIRAWIVSLAPPSDGGAAEAGIRDAAVHD